MRRDLVIALFVSLLLHAGLALGFNSKPVLTAVSEPVPTVEIILVPPIEPDEPLPLAEASAQSADAPSRAPAPLMQADPPSVALDAPFPLPIQLPPLADLGRPVGRITIPIGRPGSGNTGSGNGSGFGNIFDLSELDQNPVPLIEGRLAPLNPTSGESIFGEVEIGFIIDAAGNPHDAYVIRSDHRELEASALAQVLGSKFIPGKKTGLAVSTRATRVVQRTP